MYSTDYWPQDYTYLLHCTVVVTELSQVVGVAVEKQTIMGGDGFTVSLIVIIFIGMEYTIKKQSKKKKECIKKHLLKRERERDTHTHAHEERDVCVKLLFVVGDSCVSGWSNSITHSSMHIWRQKVFN